MFEAIEYLNKGQLEVYFRESKPMSLSLYASIFRQKGLRATVHLLTIFTTIVAVICVLNIKEVGAYWRAPSTSIGQRILKAIPEVGFDDVDFDLKTLRNIYHPGNLYRLRAQMLGRRKGNNFSKTKPFKLVIIGGSVPFGSEVPIEARYSSQMQQWLDASDLPIVVQNIAAGGCGTHCWLNKISPWTTPELWSANFVLVDVSMNDQNLSPSLIQFEHTKLIALLGDLPQKPEVAFIEELRVASTQKSDMKIHCTEEDRNEAHGIFYCGRWWDLQTHAEPVLRYHNISYISYRDGFWPNKFDVPSKVVRYWNGLSHPDIRGHRLLAKTAMFLLGRMILDSHSAVHEISLDKPTRTVGPARFVFMYDWTLGPTGVLNTSVTDGPKITGFGWTYKEYKPRKKSWTLDISAEGVSRACRIFDLNRVNSSVGLISFHLSAMESLNQTCGDKFVLTYIRGHDPVWGTVNAVVQPTNAGATDTSVVSLNASWPELRENTPHSLILDLSVCATSIFVNFSINRQEMCTGSQAKRSHGTKFALLGAALKSTPNIMTS